MLCKASPMRVLLWVCCFLASYNICLNLQAQNLQIQEFVAHNSSGLQDDDGDFSDWLEIYNSSTSTIALEDYSLTDDSTQPQKWSFPNIQLGAGETLVLFASGKDRRQVGQSLHTNFKLSASGEYLGLYSCCPTPTAIQELNPFPVQAKDLGYGLNSMGQWRYLSPPSPGDHNNPATEYLGLLPAPTASHASGITSSPFQLSLSATSGSNIRYTLDSQEPSITEGMNYSGTISIAPPSGRGLICVRARAYKTEYYPSSVSTHSYIFPDAVFSQSASQPDFPQSWGSHPAVDYEMDPEITQDPAYANLLGPALQSIPSISINLPTDDLFGTDGIYSNPTESDSQYERQASVEYFGLTSNDTFQIDCGLQIHGGSSRLPENSAKHSFRLLFQERFGEEKLIHDLFGGSNSRFNTLVLRSGYNNSWMHHSHEQRKRALYVRDQLARDLQRDMGRVSPNGSFAHLFINGLYWGLYNLTERPDAHFMASYFGGDAWEYDIIKANELVDGSRDAWDQLMLYGEQNLAEPGNYALVESYLDIDSFIDYMLLNIYLGNTDWPHHNWYCGRRRTAGSKFHFFSWDAEHTLEALNHNSIGVNNVDSPGILWDHLRSNFNFRVKVADRAHELLKGGLFEPNQIGPRFSALLDQVEASIVLESARWGDYRRDVAPIGAPLHLYDHLNHWLLEADNLSQDYFPVRDVLVKNQLIDQGLYLTQDKPIASPPGGLQSSSLSVSLAADQHPVYYTLDGSDPRLETNGDLSPSAQLFTNAISIDSNTQVLARSYDGGVWSPLMNESYLYSGQASPLRVSELMYHPEDSPSSSYEDNDFEYLEITNASPYAVNLSDVHFTDGIEFSFANRPLQLINANERILIVKNLQAFTERYGFLNVEIAGEYTGSLSNSGEQIEWMDGGSIIQQFTYDDAWHSITDGQGSALVVTNEFANPAQWNLANHWQASSAGGSPGVSGLGLGGYRVKGDITGDGQLNLSDVISFFDILFGSGLPNLPCQTPSMLLGGNKELLNLNGDQSVNISDILYALTYLFQSGPEPVGGLDCQLISDCIDVCTP